MYVYWSWPQAIRLTDKQLLCSNQTIFAQLTQVTFDHSIYTLYFLRGIALIITSKKEDAKQTRQQLYKDLRQLLYKSILCEEKSQDLCLNVCEKLSMSPGPSPGQSPCNW